MNVYVGITDRDWFRFLRGRQAVEMNFWRPRNTNDFGVLKPGELFFFKTKSPENKVVGGAFFVRHTTLTLDLAWEVFGEANGVESLSAFRSKINSIRGDQERNPKIGCTVLTQPFYLADSDFWSPPNDWFSNIVSGKKYDARTAEGERLYRQAVEVISKGAVTASSLHHLVAEPADRYGSEQLIRPRLGQGGFRVVVMDEYDRRCAITGERTLPVLQAAHIQPYSEEGPHEISNGLFLRSDLHTLFDRGYITVTNELHVEVSPRLREEFSNGRDYYALHGSRLKVLPPRGEHQPARSFLEWHQENCFLGA